MRLTVFANCQAAPIASLLGMAKPELEILPCPAVHTVLPAEAQRIHDPVAAADIVVHQPIGTGFGPISIEALKAAYPNKTFVSFPSIFFAGLFPQLCYLRRPAGSFIKGPLTDYHDSRIVEAFLNNLPVEACLEQLRQPDARLLASFDEMLAESQRRETDLDIRVMDMIRDTLEAEPPLYTFNHPSNAVLWHVARAVLNRLNLFPRQEMTVPRKPYLDNTVAAVPEILAERLDLSWRRPDYEVHGARLNMEELIRSFYDLYAAEPDFPAICRANASRLSLPIRFAETQPSQTSSSPSKPARSSADKDPIVHVSSLLSDLRIGDFSDILPHYHALVPDFAVCVDGGAGLGETAEKILAPLGKADIRVIAYEPNRNNVAKFAFSDPRLTLIDKAVGATNGTASFVISATTQMRAGGSQYLAADTSFVGKLATTQTEGTTYDVAVTRIEDSLIELGIAKVDFMKLDLQGGELDALKGMGDMLGKVGWMWLEYGGQEGLLEYLNEQGFVLFDTEYLFVGAPSELSIELFNVDRRGRNSIGKEIYFGRRRHYWTDYARGFSFAQRHRRMVQTDLVAVSPHRLPVFLDAAYSASLRLTARDRVTIPRKLF